MSTWLVVLVTLCYVAVGVEQTLKGAPWIGLIWFGYAVANVGMIMGALR